MSETEKTMFVRLVGTGLQYLHPYFLDLNLFFVFLTALCLWSSVTAIQCYWCHSDTDSTCLDPYDGNSFHEFNCTSEGDQCAKATAIGKFVGIPFTQGW